MAQPGLYPNPGPMKTKSAKGNNQMGIAISNLMTKRKGGKRKGNASQKPSSELSKGVRGYHQNDFYF